MKAGRRAEVAMQLIITRHPPCREGLSATMAHAMSGPLRVNGVDVNFGVGWARQIEVDTFWECIGSESHTPLHIPILSFLYTIPYTFPSSTPHTSRAPYKLAQLVHLDLPGPSHTTVHDNTEHTQRARHGISHGCRQSRTAGGAPCYGQSHGNFSLPTLPTPS